VVSRLQAFSINQSLVGLWSFLPRGQHWPAKHFLRTAYHQIWLPLTYVQVKCHFTAEIVA